MSSNDPLSRPPEIANVVVTADMFSPGVVTRAWLVDNKVLPDKDIMPGSVFEKTAVQVQATKFELTLLKSVLQFAPKVEAEGEAEFISVTLGSILKLLQVPAYSGFAFNYSWFFFPDGGDSRIWTRKMFYQQDKVPFSLFSATDARFGAYLSTDFDGLRLKLDIKPVSKLNEGGEPQCAVEFSFNFTSDLKGPADKSLEKIVHAVAKWDAYRSKSSDVVMQILEAGK